MIVAISVECAGIDFVEVALGKFGKLYKQTMEIHSSVESD